MELDLVSLLEQSALGAEMRGSIWLYPLFNVVHVLALLIFFAAVATMDARLLGSLGQMAVADVLRPCRRISATAFVVQATSGMLLFSADAAAVSVNPVFLAKMLVVGLALANVVALESRWGRALAHLPVGAPVPAGARLCAGISLAGWLAAAALGRLIAYA
ncbi:MAG: hypothetical protein IPK78_16415 [Rhodospirillales bacterium]|nr:hypothetical protein [Rhodospirillales bacterium]